MRLQSRRRGVESKSDSNLLVTHDQRRYQMEILKLADMKWRLLRAVYRNKPGDWEGLARALIAQHVPEFKITTSLPKPCRRRGAPPRRHPSPSLALWPPSRPNFNRKTELPN